MYSFKLENPQDSTNLQSWRQNLNQELLTHLITFLYIKDTWAIGFQ